MSRTLLLAVVLALAAPAPFAREQGRGPLRLPDAWLQGYVRTISGNWIMYRWAYPGQTRTLLSRTTDGEMAVEWEGEPVPDGPPETPVTYLWHAGTASGYGAHRFSFFANGQACATFTSGKTTADREWTVFGASGSALSFKATRVGTFNELFGFMWLTAPRSFFGTGAPRFRVVGEAANTQDYYLGPQEPVREGTRVGAEEAVLAGGRRAIRVEISHIGEDAPVVVRTGDRVLWSGQVDTGHSGLLVPAGPNEEMNLPVRVELGGAVTFDGQLALTPVQRRELHLLPHSHVDIGYSDPQPEVERKQWKNLEDAVGLGLRTADYPAGARFKWNVEGLWSVESYLAQASPDQRRAFIAAVKNGTIGLQANYASILTGLATPEELRAWTMAARRLQAEYGFDPIRSVMHTDVPGLSWTVVAALAESGVRYFSSGPNYMPGLPDGGDRIGATLKALGDWPFWWVSQSGEERLLFWMAGRGYSWFHGLNVGHVSDRGRDAILEYARALTANAYPYDLVQVRYTIRGDNGPVDPDLPDFVRAWNERFETPRLVIDTTESLFAEFERRHGRDLPEMAGDMTPYWEDGALSSAAEETAVRGAARRLAQAERLSVLAGIRLPPDRRAEAWRNILLWHEHTWGAADSISQPDRPDVMAQWEYKRQFAVQASRQTRALLEGATPRIEWTGTGIDVINTLSWQRSGLVLLPAAWSTAGDRVLAGNEVLPSQRLSDGTLAVWVDRLMPFRSVRLRVRSGKPGLPRQPVRVDGAVVDNSRLGLTLDEERGAVTSLRWAGADGHEFVSGDPGLFRYLYVPGRDPGEAVGGSLGRLTIEDAGPIVATVRLDGAFPGTTASTLRIRMVASTDVFWVQLDLDKARVRAKESAHVAFPLRVPGGVTRVDLGEALVEIGRDQLPGSCRDFIGAHSAVDVSNDSLGLSLVSQDAPLIELGAITDERIHDSGTRAWRERVSPGATLYAYLLNNYWHTNFKADQSGPLSFRFAVRPHGAFDPVELWRMGAEQDYPLVAFISDNSVPPIRPPFTIQGASVVVSSLREEGGAITARLYNASDSQAVVRLHPGPMVSALLGQDRDGRFTVPLSASTRNDGRDSFPPNVVGSARSALSPEGASTLPYLRIEGLSEPITLPAHGTRVIQVVRQAPLDAGFQKTGDRRQNTGEAESR
ncbi:MAG: hypothetical protein AB1806_07815 [Acidobacteriota bacterium]